MFSPYLWVQVRRKMPGILMIALMGLAAGCLLCILHGAELKNSQELDAVYDRIDVPCVVTNLTGTQTDGLALPSWVTDFFFAVEGDTKVSVAAQSFAQHIRDPWAKMTLTVRLNGANQSLVGITGLEADKSLRPENGCEIEWYAPYGEEIFGSDQLVCLAPWDLAQTLPEEADGTRRLTLSVIVNPYYQDITPQDATFTVIGTYSGGSGGIYCPWMVTRDLSLSIAGTCLSDSVGAYIRNPREIDLFWESTARNYFVQPDPAGTQVPWGREGPYQYYPYALFVNDTTLRQTIATLEREQEILHLLSLVILVLALAVGFMTSFLLLHRREKELALQCVLGVPKRVMICSALVEQLALILVGLAVSAAGYFALDRTSPPWAYLGVYVLTDGLGAAAAMGVFLRRDLTAALKGE